MKNQTETNEGNIILVIILLVYILGIIVGLSTYSLYERNKLKDNTENDGIDFVFNNIHYCDFNNSQVNTCWVNNYDVKNLNFEHISVGLNDKSLIFVVK